MQDRLRIKRTLLTLVSLALFAAVALPERAAFAEEPRDLIHSRTLDNGLDVIVIPNPAVPIVTIELTVKNGAFTETPELNGLSHLYEHMFFKGNAVIPNQEAYLKRMRELGIVFNGTTSAERVNYFFTLPTDNLAAGLQFMYDATVSPLFDPEEFEKEKQVVLGEVDRNESNPGYWLYREVNKLLWYEYPERKDPLGTRDAITNATVEQMAAMKATYYVPNNSVVLVAGDVEPDRAFALVEQVFGRWERGADPFEAHPVPEHPPLRANAYVVVEQPVQVPTLQLNWHGPSVDEDPAATYAADVLSYILSQPTSRFYKNLVDSGITLGSGLGYYTQRYTGPIYAVAQMQPERLRDAIGALVAEIYAMTDPAYFTDEQLESAKTILAVQDLYGREATSSFVSTVSYWWAVAGLDYYLDYVANLQRVSREDIARYVTQYIIGKPLVAGLLISPEARAEIGMSEAELRTLVEQALEQAGSSQNGESQTDQATP